MPADSHRAAAVVALVVILNIGCRESSAPPAAASRPAELDTTVDHLIVGDRPTLPGAFEGLSLGPAIEGDFAVPPSWDPIPAMHGASRWLDHSDYPGARFQVVAPHGVLHAQISVPAHSQLWPRLTQAWGEPATCSTVQGVERVWFDPEQGIRAHLMNGPEDTLILSFTHYVPAARLVGVDGARFAFEAHPILDKERQALLDAYDDLQHVGVGEPGHVESAEEMARHPVMLVLPPTEWGARRPTEVTIQFDRDGRADHFSFPVSLSCRDAKSDELVDLFARKWGAPRATSDGERVLEFSSGNRRILVDIHPYAELVVTVDHPWRVAPRDPL